MRRARIIKASDQLQKEKKREREKEKEEPIKGNAGLQKRSWYSNP